jgi:hypothetical protein
MRARIEIHHARGISDVTHYWWRLVSDNELIAAEVNNHRTEESAKQAAKRAKRMMAEAEIEG